MARRLTRSRSLLVLLVLLPAVALVPSSSRPFVLSIGVISTIAGYALLQLLSSGFLNDPSWRRPGRQQAGWLGRWRSREYVVPIELPPPPGLLIGRDAELGEIRSHLISSSVDGGPHVVLVAGPPGIGKSAIAVSVAHQMAHYYVDGQLLARLDRIAGHHDLVRVMREFVTALGNPQDAKIEDEELLWQRFRALSRSRRILILLDGATNLEHVQKLLPTGRGCAVLVTTRRRWLDEVSWPEATVGALTEDASLKVLGAVMGDDRVKDEEKAALRIVDAAARSPFALQLAGVALAGRRNWTLRIAVQRMADSQLPSDVLAALPEFAGAVHLSYVLLTEQEQRAFALLGMLKERTFARWEFGAMLRGAAQAGQSDLGGHSDAVAERILERLVQARLVERRVDDGSGVAFYNVHELVMPYVRARLTSGSPVQQRTVQRVEANLTDERQRRGERSAEEILRVQVYERMQAGELSLALSTAHEAVALCADRLHSAQDDVTRVRAANERALALASLAEVNAELGWLDIARQRAEEAREVDFAASQARAIRCLGAVNRRLYRLAAAEEDLSHAVELAREAGDASERIRALRDRAVVRGYRDDFLGAEKDIAAAQALCVSTGDGGRRWLAGVFWAHGVVLTRKKSSEQANQVLRTAEQLCVDAVPQLRLWQPWIDHQRALLALAADEAKYGQALAERASVSFRDMQHRYGIAHCRLVIGRCLLAQKKYADAVAKLEDALQTFVGCGDRWIEAYTRLPLAQALRAADMNDAANWQLIQAAQSFDDLGHPRWRNSARGLLNAAERLAIPLIGGRGREFDATLS